VRDALEMHEFGVEMFRQRIRREQPSVDEAQVSALTLAWLIAAPGPDRLRAALGDRAWCRLSTVRPIPDPFDLAIDPRVASPAGPKRFRFDRMDQ
jgi:hypothetical protein